MHVYKNIYRKIRLSKYFVSNSGFPLKEFDKHTYFGFLFSVLDNQLDFFIR